MTSTIILALITAVHQKTTETDMDLYNNRLVIVLP